MISKNLVPVSPAWPSVSVALYLLCSGDDLSSPPLVLLRDGRAAFALTQAVIVRCRDTHVAGEGDMASTPQHREVESE